MEFLFSNYPPVKTSCKTFADAFYDLLSKSSKLDIAVGYVSSDAMIELKRAIELNDNIKLCNLVIGMHYFENFTKVQYQTAIQLNQFLQEHKLGGVSLVTTFRYHGKLYSYSDESGPFAGIIGSNNLSSIVDGGARVYEGSVLIDESPAVQEINNFIGNLIELSCSNIGNLDIDNFNSENHLLDGLEFVQKVSAERLTEIICKKTNVFFDIPLKTYEDASHSNLNVYFGKGRMAKNGLIKPRHWYEVELIVPKSITSQLDYPQAGTEEAIFTVITDDGWQFKCKVSGDYSKNFRSEGDLKILGKWMKGRLENSGVLVVGAPVTSKTLKDYGRNTLTLTKTLEKGIWVLDFGVKK